MTFLIVALMTATAAIVVFKLVLFAAIVAIGAKTLIVPSRQLSPAKIHAEAIKRLQVNRY